METFKVTENQFKIAFAVKDKLKELQFTDFKQGFAADREYLFVRYISEGEKTGFHYIIIDSKDTEIAYHYVGREAGKIGFLYRKSDNEGIDTICKAFVNLEI